MKLCILQNGKLNTQISLNCMTHIITKNQRIVFDSFEAERNQCHSQASVVCVGNLVLSMIDYWLQSNRTRERAAQRGKGRGESRPIITSNEKDIAMSEYAHSQRLKLVQLRT